MREAAFQDVVLEPGYVFLPKLPTRIASVVGCGVAVTLFDRRLRRGGMAVFLEPVRRKRSPSSPVFACPAIVGLMGMFQQIGSRLEQLEAQVFGGSESDEARLMVPGLGERNVEAALEILERENVWISTQDVGGIRGRKIVFNTLTGEVFVAKVNGLRQSDWYQPAYAG